MLPTPARSGVHHEASSAAPRGTVGAAWAAVIASSRKAVWPAAGLALALLLSLTPAFALLDRAWHDIGLRWLAIAPAGGSTLLVDIDEGSLQALRASHGSWPWSRELHAAVAERLLALGARAVVFNLLFADPRDGDEALQLLASRHPGRIVFGADARRDASVAERPASPKQRAAGWSVDRAVPAYTWAGWVPPGERLLPDQPRIGVLQLALDTDGQLRCASLLHRVDGLILPSLLLAGLTAGEPLPLVALAGDGRTLEVGARRWPLDRQGCVTPRLPHGRSTVPVLPFATLATGSGDPAGLSGSVRGRTVYIGSPSTLDARAMTPLGPVGGTAWQAMAHESLAAGLVVNPASAWSDAALLSVALLPALAGLQRRQPSWRLDLRDTMLALAVVVAAAGAMLALWARPSALPLAGAVLACGLLAAAARWQAWLGAQRSRAEIEQARAVAAERSRAEFLAHMSHEIRTPLNAVIGMAQLLSETPLTPLQQRYLAVFREAGSHLHQLVDDVLDLSRLESGTLPIEQRPMALRPLVDGLEALFQSQAAAKGLALQVDLDPALPAAVVGDRLRLRQVLVNLLGNACKFTDNGMITLRVDRDAMADAVRFVVQDTGIGMTREQMAHVFEAFVQADDGVARRHGGSGLGLTISRRLVLAMGGRIAIDRRDPVGTEVQVLLPLPAWQGALPDGEPPSAVVDMPADLAGRRVLLAEDNPHNRLVVEGLLSGSGVTLESVPDGEAAVLRACQAHWDLVLMDLQMPRLDGLAATRAIRAAERAAGRAPVPIVALSANALAADRQASLDAGCNDHLGKPFAKAALLHLLRQQMASPVAAPDPARRPGFDPAVIAERFEGDEALFAKVLQVALEQWRTWADDYARRSTAGDEGGCRRLAHDLKSGAATLGANRLSVAGGRLELAIVKGQDRGDAHAEVLAALAEVLA